MAVKHQDPGGSATGGTHYLNTPSSGVTAQTSVTNGQPYAYKFDTGSPAANQAAKSGVGVLQAAGNRICEFVMMPALPATDASGQILGVTPTGSFTRLLQVTIGSDGKLRLYTNNTITILGAAGASVLSVSSWYRITLSYAITTTTNWSAKVYIDGVLEMTRTNADGTLSSAAPADVSHNLAAGAGTSFLAYISDIWVDDTTDQSDPGNVHVTAKQPTTTTTNGFDTTLGTGAVNERPVSTTNGKQHAATGDVDQDYDLQIASAGDVDITGATILGYTGWIWAALSSLTGTPLSKLILAGARIATSWDPASANTAQLFTSVVTSSSYPRHASNGKNIGSSSSTIAADTFLYDCGVIISYIPAAGGSGFKDAVARFRLASAAALKDIASRFRLASAATYRDAPVRLRLVSAAAYRNATARLRLQGLAYRDAGLRFQLVTAGVYRDATTRFRLVATGFKDGTARFKLESVTMYRDAGARLRLAGLVYRDATARLRLLAGGYRDATARLRLQGLSYRDAGLRLRVRGQGYRDATARFQLAASTARRAIVTWVEFSVPGLGYKDAGVRLRLRSASAYRNATTRLRLASVAAYRDTAVRLRLRALSYRDAGLRLRLRATAYRDMVGRFNVGTPPSFRDARARLRLRSVSAYQDVAVRFRLQSVARFVDATARLRLRAVAYRDGVARFRLLAEITRDGQVRFRLAGLQRLDATARFNLVSAGEFPAQALPADRTQASVTPADRLATIGGPIDRNQAIGASTDRSY